MAKTTVPAIPQQDIVSSVAKGNNRSALIAEDLNIQPYRLRALDKALQNAKKEGLISYFSKTGWSVVSPEPTEKLCGSPTAS